MNFTEHVKIREEKFGMVIFETLKEKVFVTNQTGKDILNLLEKGYSADKIMDELSRGYTTQSGNIRDDVIGFITQLKDNGILTQ